MRKTFTTISRNLNHKIHLKNLEPEISPKIEWKYTSFNIFNIPVDETLSVTKSGKYYQYPGPGTKIIFNGWYTIYKKIIVDKNQYLRIQKKNGVVEYISGPSDIAYNEDMIRIEKYDKILISENQALSITSDDYNDIIYGPHQYTPNNPSEIHQFMELYTCSDMQYLKIEYINGKTAIKRGPVTICNNPSEIKKISKYDGFCLDKNSRVIVSSPSTNTYQEIIGPCVYFPENYDDIFKLMKTYILSETEYIKVLFYDGNTQIIKGPRLFHENLFIHAKCEKHDAIILTKNDCIRTFSPRNSVDKIIQGPQIFIPDDYYDEFKMIEIVTLTDKNFATVLYLDGRGEIISGPSNIIKDTSKISEIKIHDKIIVKDNDAISVEENHVSDVVNRRIIYGPCLFTPATFSHTVTRLGKYFANESEYLLIEYTSGKRSIMHGPVHKFCDGIEIKNIKTCPAIFLNDHEILVSYRGNSRNIIRGPQLYFPSDPDEIIHNFSWHGNVKGTTKKAPNALNFTKLRTGSHQLYYNVESVRTMDDANIMVKFMIFYEYTSIEQMLENTNDPIANLINAVTADVVSFASNKTFEEFKKNIDILNDISYFINLIKSATSIGIEIKQIVYRGLEASSDLETLCHQALCKRTEILMQEEASRKHEEIENFQLSNKLKREEDCRQNEKLSIRHSIEKQELLTDAEIMAAKKQIELKKQQDLENLIHDDNKYKILSNHGVNVQELLLAPHKYQKVEKLINIVGTNNLPVSNLLLTNFDKE